MDALAPLLVALTGLPALGIAAWYARGDHEQARGLALHWALIGLAILLGAVALYWAGDSRPRITGVAVAMALAVNGLIVSMVLRLRRDEQGRRDR
ncbi:MAG TPA: hypothetical protein VFF91_06410 [Pseudoxanthomonas sp.]|nr:hypothetical protein [Pseudoxanthomonas sp.]